MRPRFFNSTLKTPLLVSILECVKRSKYSSALCMTPDYMGMALA